MLILSSPSFQAQVFGFPTDHYPEITFGITSGIILGTVNSDSVLMDNLMIFNREGSNEARSKDTKAKS